VEAGFDDPQAVARRDKISNPRTQCFFNEDPPYVTGCGIPNRTLSTDLVFFF